MIGLLNCNEFRGKGLGAGKPILFLLVLVFLLSSEAFCQNPVELKKPPTPADGPTSAGASASPALLDPPLIEAKALLDQGKIADADRTVREYLTTHPNSADGHFMRGYILFREVQSPAVTDGSAPVESYRDPAMTAHDSGFQEAVAKASLAEFTEGAKYHAPSAFDLKIVGLDYIVLGDYVDADKWLTHSLQWNPKDAGAWYLIGRTKYNENRFEEAAQSFEQFLKFEPKSVEAEDNLGLAYAGLGQTDKAIAAYKSAIAWQSQAAVKNPGPLLDLGILLMDQNRPQEAVSCFLQAVSINPKESRHHEELGQAYSRLAQLPKAQEELETAVSLSPQNPRLHYLLGTIYRKEGFGEKADLEFRRSDSLKASQTPPVTPQR